MTVQIIAHRTQLRIHGSLLSKYIQTEREGWKGRRKKRKKGNLFLAVQWQLTDIEEMLEINVEGMIDLENNLATITAIIVLGKNHHDANINGSKFDKNQ